MAKKQNENRKFIGGSGKEYLFPDGGQIINCFISIEDLMKLPKTEKGYVRFVVAERKDPDQFKNTHYFYEDTFVPDAKKGGSEATTSKDSANGAVVEGTVDTDDNEVDDLPF